MDKGKARTEGFDQHASVRVIQKPIPYTPTRYPSVVQDWAGAAQENEGNRNTTRKYKDSKSAVHRFETIDEEPGPSASPDVTVNGRRNLLRDTPVSSVERDDLCSLTHPKTRPPRLEESRGTEAISETRRLGSIELGSPDFRRPVVQNLDSIMAKIDHGKENGTSTPSRKRKKSPEEIVSQKEPRLEKPNGRTSREDIPESQTARNWSLSSAGSEKTGPSESGTPKKRGLGLGITSSPVFKRSLVLNPPDESAKSDAQQPTRPFFTGPVYAHNVPDSSDNLDDSALPKVRDSVLQEARKLHSALHGQSPSNCSPSLNSLNKATPGKGRSVSFAKPERTPSKLTPGSKSRPNAKERLKERLERETNECKNLKQKIDKLEENRGDLKHIKLLHKVQETLAEVLRLERNKQKNSAQRAKFLRPELESYWKELEEYEASIGASRSPTENREPVTTPLPQKNNTDRNTDNKTPISQGSVQSKSSRKTRSASVNGQTVPTPEKQSENSRSPSPSTSPVKPASANKTPAAANSQVVEDVMDNTPVEKGSALPFGDDIKLLPSEDGFPVKTEPGDMSSSSGSDGEEEYKNNEDKTESGSGSDDKTKVEIKNKSKSENESDNDSGNEDESEEEEEEEEESKEPGVTKADLLRKVNIASSPPSKSPLPSQPWQPVNVRVANTHSSPFTKTATAAATPRDRSDRVTLRSLLADQNAEKENARKSAPSSQPVQKPKKSIFDLTDDDDDDSSDGYLSE